MMSGHGIEGRNRVDGIGKVEGVMILCSDFPFIFLGYFSEVFCGEDVCKTEDD